MKYKNFFLLTLFAFLGFFAITVSSATDQGNVAEVCPYSKYPWYDEKCVNASGIRNPCKDIRECDFTDAILALGGWPTVCGWVEEKNDGNGQPKEWPKVCCGMPQTLGAALRKEFVKLMTRTKSSSTSISNEEVTDALQYEHNNTNRCALPLVPLPDTSVKPEDGIRFGNTPHSRQEFIKNFEFMESLMSDSIFAMEFKTSAENGVMFYVSAYNTRLDYIGLFMQDGKLVYVFECGSGSAVITTMDKYNDGKWHRVVFWRQNQEGLLVVDEGQEITGRSPGSNTRIDELKPPFYVGGLPEEVASRIRMSLQGITSSFPGCIRNVEAQGEFLEKDGRSKSVGTTACTNSVEEGTFFYADGGYVILYERYRVGQRISISMEIKPRNASGVLMAIHGKEDYLILQLVDGRIEFTVDNGAGSVTAIYSPGDKHYLCDGQFHTIKAASKPNNYVTLSVDDTFSEKRMGTSGVSATDTFDPLYVGGLPKSSASKRGVLTTDQYVGCMRNLEVDQRPESMAKSRVVGHVTYGSCPTT